MILSKLRKWIFPSKDDYFDDSYDYLVDFFNTLDEEFGGVSDFIFGYRIAVFKQTKDQLLSTRGGQREYGLVTTSGEVYQYLDNRWVFVERIGRLPKLRNRDPKKTDIGVFQKGDVWLNQNSGEIFKLLGTVDNNGVEEAIWVNKDGNVTHQTDFIEELIFYPKMNFKYQTKKMKQDGTFGDDLLHMSGIINGDGVLQYFTYDTHADIFINDSYIGTLRLNREKIQTLMDFEYFNPEGGLPSHDDPAIYPWYKRFERLLILIERSSKSDYNLKKEFNQKVNFSSAIFDILEDQTIFEDTLLELGVENMSSEELADLKERYRSFFAALNFQEMDVVKKQWALYLLGVCVAWEAYDGNIYYINGNEVLADGNTDPSC